MTMLQIHSDAIGSASVTFHEFLLRYKANARIVYGIVEGKEDPMFYRGLIERHLPEEWEVELVAAGCKDNVLRAMAAFDWTRFSQRRICFFVDRDLSCFVSEIGALSENLYITEKYSIENDAVNSGVFKRLLIEVLNVSDLKPVEVELVESRFSSALAFFQEAMVPIMAQIILWQREGKKPCLNDIRLKDFFLFTDGTIKLRSEFESTLSRLQHAGTNVGLQPAEQAELSKAEEEFRNGQGPERFVRGKYLIWFLVEFALEAHRSIASLVSRFAASPKMRVSIGPSNAMVVLAPRVRCPASLQQFLEQTFGQYIREKGDSLTSGAKVPAGATI